MGFNDEVRLIANRFFAASFRDFTEGPEAFWRVGLVIPAPGILSLGDVRNLNRSDIVVISRFCLNPRLQTSAARNRCRRETQIVPAESIRAMRSHADQRSISQRPLNFGSLFSAKALMPSCRSEVIELRQRDSRSNASPFSSVAPVATFMQAFVN